MIEYTTPDLMWFVIDGKHNIKLDPGLVIAAPDSYTSIQHEPRIAEVLTPWVGNEVDGFTQQIEVDHAPFVSTDAVGQTQLIPDPNMGMASIECGADTLAAIEADPTYHVNWSEAE